MGTGTDLELLSRVVVAALAGLVIGFEREFRGHAAGLRTMAMVSIGACVFTLVGTVAVHNGDPTRIAAQVSSGVGFLGAGAILRQGANIKGLTTAAAVWVTAALGTAAGFGHQVLVAGVLAVVLVVLLGVQPLERRLFTRRQSAGLAAEPPESFRPR